jgi:hypothetical protein
MIRAWDMVCRRAPTGGGAVIEVSGIGACIPYVVERVKQGPGERPRYVSHPERVLSIVLNLFTDKVGHDRYAKEVGCEPARSSAILDLTVMVLLLANTPDDEELFTHWTNLRRTGKSTGGPLRFHASRVRAAVKITAVWLGPKPSHFSAHSLHKGGTAVMVSSGVPARIIEMRGAWAKSSTAMRERYALPSLAEIGPMGAGADSYDAAEEGRTFAPSVAIRGRRLGERGSCDGPPGASGR